MHRKGIHVETLIKWGLGLLIFAVIAAFFIPGVRTAAENLFGFLNKNYGNGITEGKALHVVGDGNNQIWEFHITNGETTDSYPDVFDVAQFPSLKGKLVHTSNIAQGPNLDFFILSNSPDNKCLLFITKERSGAGTTDYGNIYYINPGTKIQDGCGSNVRECIDGGIVWEGCIDLWKEGKVVGNYVEFDGKFIYVGYCIPGDCPHKNDLSDAKYCGYSPSDKTQFNSSYYLTTEQTKEDCPRANDIYPICEEKEEVEKMAFTETEKYDWMGKCGDALKGTNPYCNLLVPQDHTYQIKYGLVCDANGKWQVCTEEREKNGDDVQLPDGATLTCLLDNNFFKWK